MSNSSGVMISFWSVSILINQAGVKVFLNRKNKLFLELPKWFKASCKSIFKSWFASTTLKCRAVWKELFMNSFLYMAYKWVPTYIEINWTEFSIRRSLNSFRIQSVVNWFWQFDDFIRGVFTTWASTITTENVTCSSWTTFPWMD